MPDERPRLREGREPAALHEGYEAADSEDEADLLIINTCSIRDKAEHRLYSDLGLQLRRWKEARPERVLGVAGCVAQQEGDRICCGASTQVDFVFGPTTCGWSPAMAEAALEGVPRDRIEVRAPPSTASICRTAIPTSPAQVPPGRAFVTVMEGCDMFCSFCIVPHTRGREISRHRRGHRARGRARWPPRGHARSRCSGRPSTPTGATICAGGEAPGGHVLPFAELLRRLDRIPGLRRIRYTSPHPLFFDDDLIRCPRRAREPSAPTSTCRSRAARMPCSSAMRRRHDAAAYRELVVALARGAERSRHHHGSHRGLPG